MASRAAIAYGLKFTYLSRIASHVYDIVNFLQVWECGSRLSNKSAANTTAVNHRKSAPEVKNIVANMASASRHPSHGKSDYEQVWTCSSGKVSLA